VIALGLGKRQALKLLKTETLAKLLSLLIGASIVGYTFVDSEGVKQVSPVVYAAGLTMFTLIFLLPLRLWREGKLLQAWNYYKKPSLIVGVGSIGTYLFILFVYQLTQLSFVVALKENLSLAKIIAICCIVAGAILLRII
jgi:drug/metabolite transporter (DMT)-like permease